MTNKDKISSKLSEMKKENPFLVPDDYFESFSSRLQDKLALEKNSKERSLFLVIKPYIYAVSSIAAIIILTFIFYKAIVGRDNISMPTNSEIAAVFEENIYDLEDTYLSDNYSEELETEDFVSSNEVTQGYKDEIIEYLLDENIEIETIVNEL